VLLYSRIVTATDHRESPTADPSTIGRVELLIEALLFASPEPLTRDRLVELTQAGAAEVDVGLERLAASLRHRGLRLLRSGESAQLATAPEAANAVDRLLGTEARSRLSTAALETLAIIAYRQPITRTGVEAVRGVNSERAIATLQSRGLVTEVGRSDAPGRPILLGTTLEFLEYFGLADISELPPSEDAIPSRAADAQVMGAATVVDSEGQA
jgi:segregation and condensation protein B